MNSYQDEDFVFHIEIEGETFLVRELTPKDLYVPESYERYSFQYYFYLLQKCCFSHNLEEVTMRKTRKLINFFGENCYQEIDFDNWYKMAFVILRGRWGEDFDWLEKQPFSKLQKFYEVSSELLKKSMGI